MITDIDEFANTLIQDVLATADADGTTTHDAFTQRIIGHLTDAGEIDDGVVCYYRAHAVEVSGFGLSNETGRLDLFTTSFRQDTIAPSLTASALDILVRRAETFIVKCARPSFLESIDDSNPAYDMVQSIQDALPSATSIRIFVLTNSTTFVRTVSVEPIQGIDVAVQVWDLHRLQRLLSSGKLHEPINVDFSHRFGAPLPALTTEPGTDDSYTVLLAVVPGQVLAELYAEYGTRLLELNVRGFLQARGAVNKGIRETIREHPERFLAYNNGISATASKCRLVETPQGTAIAELSDLQIVNGGQTTASIYHAQRRDRADLSWLNVPAKITVLPPDRIEEFVPRISQYSNTQNRVTAADFHSNEGFHIDVEKFSRATWAPSATAGGQETRWFYERARGQYATEMARHTGSQLKAWKLTHPTKQKFTKTDLAKFVNSFDQFPHVVSLGAEKNFREFMARVNRKRPDVDQAYFERLVAMAIIFRETERIVTRYAFGGYRANIVTYTIAKLAQASEGQLPITTIWKRQGLTEPMVRALNDLCPLINDLITQTSGGANVTEYCKRPETWVKATQLQWSPPSDLADLIQPREDVMERLRDPSLVDEFERVPPATWSDLAQWCKETKHLDAWHRTLVRSLAQMTSSDHAPSQRQMAQGMEALRNAIIAGFAFGSERLDRP